jgi:hypothetical protein
MQRRTLIAAARGVAVRQCALARPHGLLVDARGALCVADSEAHRIRVVTDPA